MVDRGSLIEQPQYNQEFEKTTISVLFCSNFRRLLACVTWDLLLFSRMSRVEAERPELKWFLLAPSENHPLSPVEMVIHAIILIGVSECAL